MPGVAHISPAWAGPGLRAARLVLLILLAWLLAGWLWDALLPSRPVAGAAAPDRDPVRSAAVIASAHAFGVAATAPADGAAASAATGLRLLGVIADAPGNPGVAVLAVGGKPAQAYAQGQPVSAGWVLSRVEAQAVELRGAQGTQRLSIVDPPRESRPAQPQAVPPPAILPRGQP